MIESWAEYGTIFYRCGRRGVMTTGVLNGTYGKVYRDLIKPVDPADTYVPTRSVLAEANTPENFATAMQWLEEK